MTKRKASFLNLKIFKYIALLSLALIAFVYLSFGFYILVLKDNRIFTVKETVVAPVCPGDFYLRWIEAKSFIAGINPYDIFDDNNLASKNESYRKKITEFYHENRRPNDGSGYPPWAFPVFSVLYAPFLSIEQSRIYFGVVNFGALWFIFMLLLNRLRQIISTRDSLLVALSALALNSWYITLHNGQLSFILAAAALASATRSKGFWGLFISNALLALKPTFGAYPLTVDFLRNPRILLAVGFFTVGLWISSSIWAAENPLKHLGQMFLVNSTGGNSLVDLPLLDKLPRKLVFITGFATGLLLTYLVVIRLPNSSHFLQIALSLLLMRLFCYHRDYDNCMVFMAIVCMGVYAIKSGALIPFLLWLAHVGVFSLPSSLYGQANFVIYNSACISAFASLLYLHWKYPDFLNRLDSQAGEPPLLKRNAHA